MSTHAHHTRKSDSARMAGSELRECECDRNTLERIRARAFEIFLARANTPGDSLGDWLQAEREVMTALEPAPASNRPHHRLASRQAPEVVVPPRGEILLKSDV